MPSKLKRTLALALAGGSLAIGVPAALAAGGGGEDPAPTGSSLVQDESQPQQQQRPDREDCPEEGDGGERGSSGAAPDSATPAPSV